MERYGDQGVLTNAPTTGEEITQIVLRGTKGKMIGVSFNRQGFDSFIPQEDPFGIHPKFLIEI